jgi:TonB family protein
MKESPRTRSTRREPEAHGRVSLYRLRRQRIHPRTRVRRQRFRAVESSPLHPKRRASILNWMLTAVLLTIATAIAAGQRSPASKVELAYGDPRGADLTAWVLDAKTEIRKRWALPYEARRRVGHTAVSLTVDRSGWVTDTKVEIASEIPGFDDSAIEAIRSARLLALPDDYPDEHFALTLVFWFNEPPFDVFEGTRRILDRAAPAASEEEPLDTSPPVLEIPAEPEPRKAMPAPSGETGAPDRVFFTDGTSLEIESLETRGDLVILRRRNGHLQSVPKALIDWNKTRER